MTAIPSPVPYFIDLDGDPLDGGSIYVGISGMDARTNPVALFWDAALTIPAPQPIRTVNGYPLYQGRPAPFFSAVTSASVTVLQSNGVAVITNAEFVDVASDDLTAFIAALLSSDGAGFVGFSHSEVYPASTLGKKGQQNINPLDAPFSAAGDGVTNDRTALFNADALGPVVITANHFVATSLTFTNPVQFVGEGRLTIDAGATITFSAGISAPWQQIFYDDGAVAGLEMSRLEWFTGDADANPPTVESSVRVQLWIDSVIDRGELKAGPMHLLIDGASYLEVDRGQSFTGAGEWQTFFHWSGSATRGFSFPTSTFRGPHFTGFQFRMNTAGTIPTVGSALKVDCSYTRIEDFYIEDCYDGYENTSTVVSFLSNFQIIGSVNAGFRLNGDALDLHMDKFIIQSLGDWVTLSGVAGTINVGDAFTVSSGQTGTVYDKYDATHYRLRFVGPKPAVAATITAAGGSGTIAAITSGHQQGGIVILDNAEAFTARAGDVLGGMKGLVTFTAGTGDRDGFCFSRMETVYFDSSYEGSSMTGAYGNVLQGTWFASTANTGSKGLDLADCKRITGLGVQFVNNADAGLSIASTCDDIEFIGIKCDGNCTLGGLGDVYIGGGATGVQFIGGQAGFQGANGVTPPKSLYFDTGATDRIVVSGVDVPNGSVTNNATGTVQTWVGIKGIAPRFEQGVLGNFANDAAAAAGGVALGQFYRNGSVVMVRVA